MVWGGGVYIVNKSNRLWGLSGCGEEAGKCW